MVCWNLWPLIFGFGKFKSATLAFVSIKLKAPHSEIYEPVIAQKFKGFCYFAMIITINIHRKLHSQLPKVIMTKTFCSLQPRVRRTEHAINERDDNERQTHSWEGSDVWRKFPHCLSCTKARWRNCWLSYFRAINFKLRNGEKASNVSCSRLNAINNDVTRRGPQANKLLTSEVPN